MRNCGDHQDRGYEGDREDRPRPPARRFDPAPKTPDVKRREHQTPPLVMRPRLLRGQLATRRAGPYEPVSVRFQPPLRPRLAWWPDSVLTCEAAGDVSPRQLQSLWASRWSLC